MLMAWVFEGQLGGCLGAGRGGRERAATARAGMGVLIPR